ncbi:zf-HC2 domain-containing protein [Nocardia puris]|uniref:Putative zinc finger protein n=1 Tax=Nocardia puris TaxID=208602 RepID=A0A366DMZ5_9NOCA|nr:zf-HC2 domain-containing protein [Nocardia puris]MBF6213495.1 zf-HC2 domain-containing protein [Nocardia puris]MBF6365575.1 zf-HC2 domain-containing protein [Nocardia puris]MBF6460041.1 zf-HC2 domain-containing protein [Nocardia puris]RBO91473.1 putative zinc finger protein [Nocardia puris]
MTDIADDYTTWDAPYVLGSLTGSERREYEEHLAGCASCRAAVAELAGMPGMLGLIDADTALDMIADEPAPSVPPVPDLLPRLAAAERKRRRRDRWYAVGGAVVAAAAAVAIAIPVVSSVTDAGTPATEQVIAERSMSPLEPSPVTASFKLLADGDRARVVMTCTYGDSDQRYTWKYRLTVTGTDGRQLELDEWPAGPGTVLTVDRTLDMAPDQVQKVEIRSVATDRVILTGSV